MTVPTFVEPLSGADLRQLRNIFWAYLQRQVPPVGGTTGQVLEKASNTDYDYVWATVSAGAGTVTSVAATPPAAGFTIAGSPITTAGTLAFTLADDLAALEALSGAGAAYRSGVNTWSLIKRAFGAFVVGAVPAQDYTLLPYAPAPGTISSAWVKTSAGTLTANVKINGSSVTGISALAASSVGALTNATAANTFVVGDRVTVTVSGVSGATDFEIGILTT